MYKSFILVFELFPLLPLKSFCSNLYTLHPHHNYASVVLALISYCNDLTYSPCSSEMIHLLCQLLTQKIIVRVSQINLDTT